MNKFCYLEFCENYDYLSSKVLLIKNKKVLEYYIRKFNPFRICEINFNGLEDYGGFKVILPITKVDAECNKELFLHIVNKTLRYLNNQNVNVIYSKDIYVDSEEITFIKDTCIEIFFIKEILNRAIKVNGLSKKDVNVCVIAGGYNETEIVLKEIYDGLNFLSLVDVNSRFGHYENLTDYIFCDSGLEISFSNRIEEADIVINLSDSSNKLLKNLSDKVCIIDFDGSIRKQTLHRNTVKSVSFRVNEFYIKAIELELVMYANSNMFRFFKDIDMEYSKYLYVKEELNSLNARFSSYKI